MKAHSDLQALTDEVERLRIEIAEGQRLEAKARDYFLLEQKSRESAQAECDQLRAENDRLRAVLAETEENVHVVANIIASPYGRQKIENHDRDTAHAVLRDLRARAREP
jgi:hypothetical protein